MRNSPVMKTRTFLSLLPILPLALVAADSTVPAKQPLWPGEPPSGTGKPVPGNPSLTVHHPEKPNGTAVVICPGGGYGGLVTGAEGHGIAKWLNQHGITGIVLEYRLPKGNSFVPLADAQRAIQTARTHAADWKINPKQIGIIGFSAGGHLASTAATHYTADNPAATDPVQRVSSRPDFQILVYPVVTMGEGTHGGSKRNLLGESPTAAEIQRFSNETQVTKDTPPAYLAHAIDDKVVPLKHSTDYHRAMQAAGASSRLLELPSGGHGLNGYKGPNWDAWQTGALAWLKELGFLQ